MKTTGSLLGNDSAFKSQRRDSPELQHQLP